MNFIEVPSTIQRYALLLGPTAFQEKIARCREVAASIGKQVAQLVHENSTVGTERAVLRLLGFNDALAHAGLQFPVANYIVDQLRRADRLHERALYWTANAILATGHQITNIQEEIIKGQVDVGKLEAQPKEKVVEICRGAGGEIPWGFDRLPAVAGEATEETKRSLTRKETAQIRDRGDRQYFRGRDAGEKCGARWGGCHRGHP